jgi:hypothetical protein
MTRLLKPLLLRLLPLLLMGMFLLPQALPAQTTDPDTEEVDGGDDKEKKEKKKKEKAPKAPKEKKQKKEKDAGDDGDDASGNDNGGGEPPADPAAKETEPPKDLNGGVDDTTRVSVSCLRYKTGYMEYIDKNYHGIKIKRKGKKEIWNNSIDGNKLVFKIEWTSHKDYTLRFVKAKLPSRFRKGSIMQCEMVGCYDEYYDCDCALNGITQYASINKTPTKQEIATKQRADREKLEKEEAAKAKALQDAKEKAVRDSIAKAHADNPDAAPAPTPPPAEAKTTGEKPAKGDKPAQGDKPAKAPKEKKAKKEKKEKAPKEKKEKKEKPEKAPKEKPEKPEKPVKEKKPKEGDLRP